MSDRMTRAEVERSLIALGSSLEYPPAPPIAPAVTARLLAERGYGVENVDATVIAQAPALAPHLDSIQETLARHLGLPKDSVSIKAKSPDGLGAVGRMEGIAAQATVLLSRKDPT